MSPVPASLRAHAKPQLAGGKGFVLARKCTCGTLAGPGGRCGQCTGQKKVPGMRAKLAFAQSGDRDEMEADRVAEQVLAADAHSGDGLSTPRIQHRPTASGGQAGAVPASVHRALAGPGTALEPALRHDMERRFGHELSRVRIHADASAAESARAVDALAYTVGRDIVFGPGLFQPQSRAGRALLAHELAHVVQQNGSPGLPVQRKPKPDAKGTGGGKKDVVKATAATAPRLDLTPSRIDPPCACLLVVHNDERNARKTAELMHAGCAYNLALLSPDTGTRHTGIPGQKGMVDPNSLYPREVAEKCMGDEQSCRDFLTTKSGSTDKDEIEQFVQIQFFLAVHDCSLGFALPVVALHNNDIEDTKNYLKDKDKKGVSELKLDVDKGSKETGADQIAKLKELINKKFGKDVVTETMETAGKTNIFRWCASSDLSRCHIGDPDHPDNVTWVTNQADFTALSRKNLNVAFQSEAPASKKSESEGDLSTLLLLLKDILDVRLAKVVEALEKEQVADWAQIDRLLEDLGKLVRFGDQTHDDTLQRLLEIVRLLIDILGRRLRVLVLPPATRARIQQLRYVNIETPGKRLTDQSDAERVRNYEAIVDTLKAVGLHCCGDDPAKAERSVKEGLKTK